MKGLVNKSIFLLLLFSTRAALGTSDDSTKVNIPAIIRYTSGQSDIGGNLKFLPLDSTLDDIQIFNPSIRYFYNDLGNIGSASEALLFSISPRTLTAFGNSTFELYKWTPSNVRFYKTNKRFSNLDYHLSGGKEQQITLTLAQNILPNWNAGIDFSRRASLGFLSNGKTFTTNFDFFTWYHLPNDRYHVFASATWNSLVNEVNGGLANDSLYDSNNFSNTDLKGLKVALSDATQHVRNHIFSLTHYYDLLTKKDSSGKAMPFLRFAHRSEYERSSYEYNDNNSDTAFYTHNYFNSDIDDSLHFDQWVNRISLQAFRTFENFKPVHRASAEITGGSQWFNYEQLYDTTLTNYFAEARFRTEGERRLTGIDITGRYILSGANEKDYLFRLNFRFPLIWGAAMNIGLQTSAESPSLFQHFYESDHAIWHNDFDKTTSKQFFFGVNFEKYLFSINGTSTVVGRYIYFGTLAEPVQSHDSVRVNVLSVQKDFRFWKFGFNNSFWIQKTDNEVISLPGIVSHHTLFIEDRFFKKKLATQIGFDVHYSSSYYANAYSPAASVFYTQDSVKTNDYPLIDFYVNFSIKRARMFIKLQNIGDNLVANNYVNTPHYPMPGLLIQFGINWRFYD